ncbi:conserved hypothetical protein [Cyanobium sp. PCC 7001]|uniref:hypothetical protein n=1 Tax=Cyanobium sp. PCC 7001 TaxID=180281 RepID=UPI0001805099|nr:hypothetical protein [Cyanobium sp. PCC 7001]EDY37208.1 conserved hypothetical protein [Cyanobium sp. PCC 7001]
MDPDAGPLTMAELAELESTLLPAVERHHLRLLAHSLRTLQGIAGRRQGPAPETGRLEAWAAQVPALQDDPGFQERFLLQLQAAAGQLEAIAAELGTTALGLELEQLTQWARGQADARLNAPPAQPPPGH